jgi:hypothetical protein
MIGLCPSPLRTLYSPVVPRPSAKRAQWDLALLLFVGLNIDRTLCASLASWLQMEAASLYCSRHVGVCSASSPLSSSSDCILALSQVEIALCLFASLRPSRVCLGPRLGCPLPDATRARVFVARQSSSFRARPGPQWGCPLPDATRAGVLCHLPSSSFPLGPQRGCPLSSFPLGPQRGCPLSSFPLGPQWGCPLPDATRAGVLGLLSSSSARLFPRVFWFTPVSTFSSLKARYLVS